MVESKFVDNSLGKTPTKPIGVLAALATGFDRVAAKPVLVLIPFVLDLLLWFGPHLTLPFLVQLVPETVATFGQSVGANSVIAERMTILQQMVDLFFERYNMMSALSSLPAGMPFNLIMTFASLPAGVPSLMAGRMPSLTPIGTPVEMGMKDLPLVVGVWLVLTAIGLGLAAIYHRWLAKQAAPKVEVASGWLAWGRMALLFIVVYLGGFLLLSMMGAIASLVGALVPLIGVIVLFGLFSLLFWAAVYLAFTAHGIVLYRFRVVKAMAESIRVVRWNLLSTVGFLFLCFLITWASSQVWYLPGEESWYSMLALAGHAFVSTTLIVSSYVFYQNRRDWLVELQALIAARFADSQSTSRPSDE